MSHTLLVRSRASVCFGTAVVNLLADFFDIIGLGVMLQSYACDAIQGAM